MDIKYNLTLNKSIEVKSTQVTSEIMSNSILIKMVLTPLKEGNQRITV